MKHDFILIGCCTAGLASAQFNDYASGVTKLDSFLRVRDLPSSWSPSKQISLVRRTNKRVKHDSGKFSLASGAGSSHDGHVDDGGGGGEKRKGGGGGGGGGGSKLGTPKLGLSDGKVVSQGEGNSKVHMQVAGPGTIGEGIGGASDRTKQYLGLGEKRATIIGPQRYAYLHQESLAKGDTVPFTKFPIKAQAKGTSLSALMKNSGPRTGAMLLKAPGKPNQQIEVHPNTSELAHVQSDIPGEAKLVAAGGPATSLGVTAADPGVNHPQEAIEAHVREHKALPPRPPN